MSDARFLMTTVRAQRRASDPQLSAWVSAHAGSGKTYVLTQRVLRLLLSGTSPSQILCLTFTKAAAANMSARIFDRLGQWALLDDDALTKEIEDTGSATPNRETLDFARRLFARAVETPGGLKIQTIHAFCEKLLHIFPFEANAPAGFRVLDDMARAELLEAARQTAIEAATRSRGAFRNALECVARETTAHVFGELCDELLRMGAALKQLSNDDYALRLRARLGLGAKDSLAQVEAEITEARDEWPSLAASLRQGSTNDADLAGHLEEAIAFYPEAACVDAYLGAFYTDKGAPRGLGRAKIVTSKLSERVPGLLERMEAERDRLAPLIEKRKAAATVERSLALATLGGAIMSEYAKAKRNRNLLDYDDLIESARELLNRSNPSWVLYKLDSQIDHILLDEAQDTSAPQWEILSAIAREFCDGVSARRALRSFFAVGDEKQSIFSFQGAAPEKFDAMRRDFEARFRKVDRRFELVRLTRSFRSAPGILDAVDIVFSHGDNGSGLSSDPEEPPPKHEASKTYLPALVEIWSPVGPAKAEAPADWRLPLDLVGGSDPGERLAQLLAAKVRTLLDPRSGECVFDGKTPRPVQAGDILFVVRKRGAFFEALIRALKSADIPVAGADRLDLANHIAVIDLVALGRASLLVEDDLTLAAVLKSPLVGFDDDDLIALAPRRPGSLYEALTSDEGVRLRGAAQQIEAWRRDAVRLAPFEFYSKVLGPDSGRRRLVARLGPEANDAIDEFLRLALSFERDQSPSLTSFLAMVEGLDLSIKRDMESGGGAVRVMTAHAAKGLEAKIVFLPDTCSAPSGKHDPKLFLLGDSDDVSLVWSRSKDSDPAPLAQARTAHREAERAEHQRLLYVALTRAEERLYISGYHGATGPAEGCWHEAIRAALEPYCERLANPDDAEGYVLRRVQGELPLRPDLVSTARELREAETPAFALTPAPVEAASPPPLRPSSALAGADALGAIDAAAPNRRDAELALIGRLTHALLQHLPGCPRERREAAAKRFLSLRAPALALATRDEIAAAAMAVIENESLASLFGPQSLAEVDVVATLGGGVAVSGRIDRLAETETEVLIADFKTGAPRKELDVAQLRQLALYRAALTPLYPGKRLRCFIVWTRNATAVEADGAALERALAHAVGAPPDA